MRIIGKYEGWESETYVMQLSPEDVHELLIILKKAKAAIEFMPTYYERFAGMLEEAMSAQFGIDSKFTEEY